MQARSDRRSILKSVLAFPFIASFQSWDIEKPQRQLDQQRLGVSLLRFVATAECRFWHAFGRYAELKELTASDIVDEMVHSGPQQKKWGDRALYDRFRFDQEHVLPGWKLRFVLAKDSSAYTLTLKETLHWHGALSIDDSGVIWVGEGLTQNGLNDANPPLKASDVLVDSSPLSDRRPRSRLFQLVAAALPQGGWNCDGCTDGVNQCCCSLLSVSCCTAQNSCSQQCSSCPHGQKCCNCGCSACPWECGGGHNCSPPAC